MRPCDCSSLSTRTCMHRRCSSAFYVSSIHLESTLGKVRRPPFFLLGNWPACYCLLVKLCRCPPQYVCMYVCWCGRRVSCLSCSRMHAPVPFQGTPLHVLWGAPGMQTQISKLIIAYHCTPKRKQPEPRLLFSSLSSAILHRSVVCCCMYGIG